MGCIISANGSEQQGKKPFLSLAERKAQAQAERKVAKSLVRNLVHEEFGRDLSEFYDVDETLGKGLQGVVRTVVHKQTGMKYAMKTVSLGQGKDSKAMAQLRSEVDLIRGLDHPNIVRLQQVFETEESLYLVMDLCAGGDMMTRWERNAKLQYSETEASLTVKKIMNAVRYCHERNVVHRDIKLENLLWEHPGKDAEPQLVDFGLSVMLSDESEVLRDDVGSIFYLAPEVLAKNYTRACDCWSVGVIAYMMLAGVPPFLAPTDEGIKLKIKWTKPAFPKYFWEKVSDEAKDFIKRLLVKDPKKRMTAAKACAHPWIARARSRTPSEAAIPLPQHIDRDADAGASAGAATDPDKALDPKVVRRISKYQDYGKLKRVALGMIAHSLNPEEIRKLRREFNKVDVEGRGVIRPQDLQKALNASGDYTPEEMTRMFGHMDVDHDGKIGFNEFLAASLNEDHINEQNLRLAFERLDGDNTGRVTMDDLKHFTGATVDNHTLEAEITDNDLRESLLGSGVEGASYEVFRMVMRKHFSTANLESPRSLGKLVRVASKMSIEALATETGGPEEDAGKIIAASKAIVASKLNTSSLQEDEDCKEVKENNHRANDHPNGNNRCAEEEGETVERPIGKRTPDTAEDKGDPREF